MVRLLAAIHVSPTQIAQDGRGMSMVQSPTFCWKRLTVESRPETSQHEGSRAHSSGKRRLRSGGKVLKMNSPLSSRCHSSPSRHLRNSPPIFKSCVPLFQLSWYRAENKSCVNLCGKLRGGPMVKPPGNT